MPQENSTKPTPVGKQNPRANTKLTPREIATLRLIQQSGPITTKELARRLKCSAETVRAIISYCRAKDWPVKRVFGPAYTLSSDLTVPEARRSRLSKYGQFEGGISSVAFYMLARLEKSPAYWSEIRDYLIERGYSPHVGRRVNVHANDLIDLGLVVKSSYRLYSLTEYGREELARFKRLNPGPSELI